MLHLQAHTTRDLVTEAAAFTCSVLLTPADWQQWSTVRVGFALVWQVLRNDSPKMSLDDPCFV